MNRPTAALLAVAALVLAACGTYQAPAPTRSTLEERQTAVAIAGRPTLPPVAAGPTRTPGPPPPTVAEALGLADDDPRAIGSPDAPVLIVEFTDFE
ncbi:MAG TPA: hypothetical protein PKD53_09770 [Chloroflexaceae bacterium]|nr:hypothetical protein [Chloroflexaceae bacterium]